MGANGAQMAAAARMSGLRPFWGILAEMPYYLWPRGAAGLLHLLFWCELRSGVWRLIPIDDYEGIAV